MKLLKLLILLAPIVWIVLIPSTPGYLLVGYFIYLLILLFIQNKFVHKIQFFRIKLNFELDIIIISLLIICVVALLDFSVVETFKEIPDFPYGNTYWYNLFNLFLPIIWGAIGFAYYLGSRNIGNGVKIFIAGIFLEYSSINDFLYYILQGIKLPDLWTWVTTPQFIIGSSFTSSQLLIWTSISLVMTIAVLALPLNQYICYKHSC